MNGDSSGIVPNVEVKDGPSKSNKDVIRDIVLSVFDEDGPTPTIYWPNDMDEASRLLVAMKTISLLMGDSVYQDGTGIDGVNYFGILPFPDLKLNGLTYFFLIPDAKARGQAKAATITILIDEENKTFFYENMKYLRVIVDKTATRIQETKDFKEQEKIVEALKDELFGFTKELKDPFSSRRKIKILYIGLDGAGKTSFLLGVKKKYSEIIKTLPTKGVERSEEKLFKEQNSQISIWDLGGQEKYRQKYLEQSKIYLYNVDLLFFLIDIQDTQRIKTALELFGKVISSMQEMDEFPPVVVCLNKYDPDLKDSPEIIKNVNQVEEEIKRISNNYFIKVFQTSIFDHWSLISAYSYGLSQLSPNRELFRNVLKQFAEKTKSEALLLLNENGIILSNFSKDETSGKVFEISAPHFQTLYKTFKEFKMLKQDYIVSSGITDEAKKKIVFKKIIVEKYHMYLLLFVAEYLGIEKIEQNLPDFSKNLIDLIKTYI